MIITEDLARCGVVNGPVWPKPEILKAEFTQYLFSYAHNYDIFNKPDVTPSDVTDVYLVSGNPNDMDSLVFACNWTTKNKTYGSTPLAVFLSVINEQSRMLDSRVKHYKTMMFIMLSLGHFTFVLKDVRDE